MNQIKKLEIYFQSNRTYEEFIEKYEENLDFFKELFEKGGKENLESIISITIYKYIGSLNQQGQYTKALNVIDRTEKKLVRLRGKSELYKMFVEGLMFQKGVVLGRMKKYRKSNVEFKKLIAKNPTNDKFIQWYKSNKQDLIYRFFANLLYISSVLMALDLATWFFSIDLNLKLVGRVGVIIIVLSLIVPRIWIRIIDKSELKPSKR